MTRKRNPKMAAALRQRQQRGETLHAVVPSVVARAQPHTEADVTRLMEPTRIALTLLLEGAADDAHFRRVAMDVNIAAMRSVQCGDNEEAMAILHRAGEALEACRRIKQHNGRYGLDAPGRAALIEAIDLYAEILRASSYVQMQTAEEAVFRAPRVGQTA